MAISYGLDEEVEQEPQQQGQQEDPLERLKARRAARDLAAPTGPEPTAAVSDDPLERLKARRAAAATAPAPTAAAPRMRTAPTPPVRPIYTPPAPYFDNVLTRTFTSPSAVTEQAISDRAAAEAPSIPAMPNAPAPTPFDTSHGASGTWGPTFDDRAAALERTRAQADSVIRAGMGPDLTERLSTVASDRTHNPLVRGGAMLGSMATGLVEHPMSTAEQLLLAPLNSTDVLTRYAYQVAADKMGVRDKWTMIGGQPVTGQEAVAAAAQIAALSLSPIVQRAIASRITNAIAAGAVSHAVPGAMVGAAYAPDDPLAGAVAGVAAGAAHGASSPPVRTPIEPRNRMGDVRPSVELPLPKPAEAPAPVVEQPLAVEQKQPEPTAPPVAQTAETVAPPEAAAGRVPDESAKGYSPENPFAPPKPEDAAAVEQVQPGEKGMQRLRSDKEIKKYLSAKRPADDDVERITDYRTQTVVGHREATEAGAEKAADFIKAEHDWAVERLRELRPTTLKSLGYDVELPPAVAEAYAAQETARGKLQQWRENPTTDYAAERQLQDEAQQARDRLRRVEKGEPEPPEEPPTPAKAPAPTEPPAPGERVDKAAVRLPSGDVVEGTTHIEALRKARDEGLVAEDWQPDYDKDQGWTTSTRPFVDRETGYEIAAHAEQLAAEAQQRGENKLTHVDFRRGESPEEKARKAQGLKPGMVVDEDGTHRFHEARTPSGARRLVSRVSNDGLIRELAALEPKRLDAEKRAQYNYTIDENFHSTEDGRTVISATNKRGADGKFGPSVQAKALQNLADYRNAMDQIYAELHVRGIEPHDIYERMTEHIAEREGMKLDEAKRSAHDDEDSVRDENGAVLFSPADRGKAPTREEVNTWADGVKKSLGLESFDVEVNRDGSLHLSMLEVPRGQRKQGIGSAAMEELTQYADEHGVRIVLSPDTKGSASGTTSRARLVDFYKRFGFRENKGRGKDFTVSAGMIREPDRGTGGPMLSPAHEGPDLFGEAPKPSAADQESLFGEKVGTEASRSLNQHERAAQSELEKLKQIQPKLTDPAAKRRASDRIVELEKLVNRGKGISAAEMSTRAEAAKLGKEAGDEDLEGPAPDQAALFSPSAPGTPLGARIAAANRTPRVQQQAAADRVKSLATISRNLAAMVDVPLRQGRFLAGARKALGAFFPDKQVARLIRFDHLETAAHEVGHYISQQHLKNPTMQGAAGRGAPALSMAMKRELVKMGKDLYGNRKPNGGYGEEGIAQWARFYVTDPARLAADAPAFSAWVEANVFPKEPALKAAMQQGQRDFADYQKAPATARADALIDVAPSRRLMPDMRRMATLMVDDVNEVRQAVKEIADRGNKQPNPAADAYTLARLSRGGAGMAEEMVQHGVEIGGKRVTRGIEDILSTLKPEDAQPLRRYLLAERTLELAKRGINSGLSVADAKEIQQLYSGKYNAVARELWGVSNALLDYRVEKGLLTQGEANYIKSRNQRRVGLFRVFDEDEKAAGQGGTGRGFGRNSSGLQAIRGSARDIVDPLESLITDVYRTVQQSHAAEVLNAMVKQSAITPGGGRVVEVLDEAPKEKVEIDVERVKQQLAALGLVPDDQQGLEWKDINGMLESFREKTTAGPRETKDLVRPLVINGERKWIQIKDAPLYDALSGLGTPQMPQWLRVASIPTRTLRAGATLTAEFMGRNPPRDAVDAAIFTRAGGLHQIPGYSFARGLFDVLGHSDMYREWKLAGGDNAAMLGIDRTNIQKHVLDMFRANKASPAGAVFDPGAYKLAYDDAYSSALKRTGSPAKARAAATALAAARARGWVLRPMDVLRMLSSISENATRLGEYRGVRGKALAGGATLPNARAEGGLASRDVTLDFGKQGTAGRAINQIVSFFSANVNGLDKLQRELRERPQVIIPRIAAWITLPSVALYLAQKDDPAYEEVPRWQKLAAWVFVDRDGKPVPLPTDHAPSAEDRYAAEYGKVKHIWRIPKPPELGYLFGSVPEQMLEWAHKRNPRSLDAIWQGFQNLNPVHWPDALNPMREAWANKSAFTGRAIVPEGIAALPPAEQATSRTGEAARALGQATNMRPAMIENTVRGYAGGLGQYGLDIGNQIVKATRSAAGMKPLPAPARQRGDVLASTPLVKGFAVRTPQLDAQSVQDAMDSFAEADGHRQVWHRKLEAGDREGAAAYLAEHRDAIRSVALPGDRVSQVGDPKKGTLRTAHDLIVQAQRLSRDADDPTRERVAATAIRAAQAALDDQRVDRADVRSLKRATGRERAEDRRQIRQGTRPIP